MNVRRTIVTTCVIIGIIIFIVVGLKNKFEKRLIQFSRREIATIDLSVINDGEYLGECSIFPIKVISKTKIVNHKIEKIEILKHRTGQGKPAERIVESILQEQTIKVSVISGATYSSRAIQVSIVNALKGN
jgi:uncharacterized protein with FMN-binding domain